MAIARDIARSQKQIQTAKLRAAREQEKHHRANLREAQREQREYARTVKEREREERQQYLEDRQAEAEANCEDASTRIEELSGVLGYTLLVNDRIDFNSLRIVDVIAPFEPSRQLTKVVEAPFEAGYLAKAKVPVGWRKLLPGANRKAAEAVSVARSSFERDTSAWANAEQDRLARLKAAADEHEAKVLAFEAKKATRNAEVDELQAEYEAGEANAIVSYCSMVLERSQYPEGFPQKFSIAYTQASKQLVVEYELPTIDIIPTVVDFRYVRSQDSIAEKPRKAAELKADYQDLIAAVTLRTLHELFEADQHGHVEAICFNGYIHTIDPATGKDIQPHLISVRTTKIAFTDIDLGRADKRACLKNLGAQVSRSPEEAQPVKPIMEFRMADARFVDQTDLISGLSDAPNLMDLNPYEFENLVANLFGQMGLESKLTRSSKDGGVDCVAFDRRPVLGGKVVIQAKRYRHTVGVSAVRDLYGTMMNEGANKGILVTTSGYGPDAFNFGKDKPIELIDGGGLLYLLQEIGMQARIVFPEID
ncbi:restriction endonuclease [Xanthobacter versatilis]|uniref:restriction endonuclease n=1 Tax=Xanthobacter autotrophicus (strain ATCC BAA-1158 / Py2) TaxID=78245 RepID=UPI00372B49A0